MTAPLAKRAAAEPLDSSGEPMPTGGSRLERWGIPRWAPIAAKIALTLLATWLILRGAGMELGEAWRLDWSGVRVDALFVALSILLCLPTFVVAAVLWSRILARFGEGRGVGVAAAAAILVVANLGRYLPGKVAQLGGVALLARRHGVSAVRAGAAAVMAQALNLAAAAVVGAWALARWPLAEVWGGAAAALGVGAALAILLGRGGPGRWLRRLLARQGYAGRVAGADVRRMPALLPGYLLIWACYGGALTLLARGLGIEAGFGAATVSFAAAYLAGYLAVFAPAGIGVRESTLALLLTPHLGVEASVLLAAAQRIWITAVELLAAAAGLLLLARAGRRRVPSDRSSDPDASVAEGIP